MRGPRPRRRRRADASGSHPQLVGGVPPCVRSRALRAELDIAARGIRLRRELHPGDAGAIAELHGRVYSREHGVDATFEADVAAGLAAAVKRGFPDPGEGIWIAEREGRVAGSVGLTVEPDGEARLRWVLLAPELRGLGLGRRMIGEAVELARACGLERLVLETFSDLRVAAAIYRSHGFELVWEQHGPKWGRAEFTYQRYELELQR